MAEDSHEYNGIEKSHSDGNIHIHISNLHDHHEASQEIVPNSRSRFYLQNKVKEIPSNINENYSEGDNTDKLNGKSTYTLNSKFKGIHEMFPENPNNLNSVEDEEDYELMDGNDNGQFVFEIDESLRDPLIIKNPLFKDVSPILPEFPNGLSFDNMIDEEKLKSYLEYYQNLEKHESSDDDTFAKHHENYEYVKHVPQKVKSQIEMGLNRGSGKKGLGKLKNTHEEHGLSYDKTFTRHNRNNENFNHLPQNPKAMMGMSYNRGKEGLQHIRDTYETYDHPNGESSHTQKNQKRHGYATQYKRDINQGQLNENGRYLDENSYENQDLYYMSSQEKYEKPQARPMRYMTGNIN